VTRQTLGHRLFRWGSLPAGVANRMRGEGLSFAQEGIPATLTLRGYRAPGRAIGWKRQLGSAAVAVSRERIVVSIYRRPIVELPLDDPRLLKISWRSTHRGLEIAFRAQDLDPERAGRVNLLLRTERSQEVLDWLAALRVPLSKQGG